jgi:hypothetical protein
VWLQPKVINFSKRDFANLENFVPSWSFQVGSRPANGYHCSEHLELLLKKQRHFGENPFCRSIAALFRKTVGDYFAVNHVLPASGRPCASPWIYDFQEASLIKMQSEALGETMVRSKNLHG